MKNYSLIKPYYEFLMKLHYDLTVLSWYESSLKDYFQFLDEYKREEIINDRLIDFLEEGMKLKHLTFILNDQNFLINSDDGLRVIQKNNFSNFYYIEKIGRRNLYHYNGFLSMTDFFKL